MIVKQRDAQAATIQALERQAGLSADAVRRSACHSAASRLRADNTTESACVYIDELFGESSEWMVLHDLRLNVGAHAVQLNHVLINDQLQFICLDTRYLNCGIEISEVGQCHAFNEHELKLIASPLSKMAKDVRMLGQELAGSDILPRRFGVGPRASVRGVVLTDPSLRLNSAATGERETVGIYPSDALFPMLWKQHGRGMVRRLDRQTPQRLLETAERLANQHRPVFSRSLLDDPDSFVSPETTELLQTAI